MRKQKLQFYILVLVLVLVVFGYLYARHYAAGHVEEDTTPSFELIEDASEDSSSAGTGDSSVD